MRTTLPDEVRGERLRLFEHADAFRRVGSADGTGVEIKGERILRMRNLPLSKLRLDGGQRIRIVITEGLRADDPAPIWGNLTGISGRARRERAVGAPAFPDRLGAQILSIRADL
jgi:hypothetical protein